MGTGKKIALTIGIAVTLYALASLLHREGLPMPFILAAEVVFGVGIYYFIKWLKMV